MTNPTSTSGGGGGGILEGITSQASQEAAVMAKTTGVCSTTQTRSTEGNHKNNGNNSIDMNNSSNIKASNNNNDSTKSKTQAVSSPAATSESNSSRGQLADQLCSSLASLASREEQRNNEKQAQAAAAAAEAAAIEVGSGSSENNSSDTSSARGHVVTASATTTTTNSSGSGSGEDRNFGGSSGSASGSQEGLEDHRNFGSGSASGASASGSQEGDSNSKSEEGDGDRDTVGGSKVNKVGGSKSKSSTLVTAAKLRMHTHTHTHSHGHAHTHAHSHNHNHNHSPLHRSLQHQQLKVKLQQSSQSQSSSLSSSASASRSHLHSHSHSQAGLRTSHSNNNDEYGLPVPVDDRLERENAHATVVARLPPPTTDSGSGGETGDSKQGDNHRNGGQSWSLDLSSLLQPHREPAFHTIRRTFKKLPKRNFANSKGGKHFSESSQSSSSGPADPAQLHAQRKKAAKAKAKAKEKAKKSKTKMMMSRRPPVDSVNLKTKSSKDPNKSKANKTSTGAGGVSTGGVTATSAASNPNDDNDNDNAERDPGGSGSSSGSGTEGGYDGSASSNANIQKDSSAGSSSSENPDFSSGASESGAIGGGTEEGFPAFCNRSPSNSPSLSSSSTGDGDPDSSDNDNDKFDHGSRPGRSRPAVPASAGFQSSSMQQKRRREADHNEQGSGYVDSAGRNLEEGTRMKSKVPAHGDWHLHRAEPSSSRMGAPASNVNVNVNVFGSCQSNRNAVTAIRPNRRVQLQDVPVVAATTSATAVSNILDSNRKPPILMAGCDVMAHILTFLEPPEILNALTMPLSKDWRNKFTQNQELWRVLCLLEPFKARVNGNGGNTKTGDGKGNSKGGSDSDTSHSLSTDSLSISSSSMNTASSNFGRYRVMYTSFVRCMRYLSRIKDEAKNGGSGGGMQTRTHTHHHSHAHGGHGHLNSHGWNHDNNNNDSGRDGNSTPTTGGSAISNSDSGNEGITSGSGTGTATGSDGVQMNVNVAQISNENSVLVADSSCSSRTSASLKRGRKRKKMGPSGALGSSGGTDRKSKKKCIGRSIISQRRLRPSQKPGGINASNFELPWSCTIYSIVNWMAAFSSVEGIQIMCLKVLPLVLEDDRQRIAAQQARLTDVVLRGMVKFPNSVQLHTFSFHTIVLLARPLGGKEGMIFHRSMVNSSSEIFFHDNNNNDNNNNGNNNNNESLGTANVNNNNANINTNSYSNNQKRATGIAVMLDSMRRFVDDEALQAMSCWSLVNIALAPIQKAVLIELGGIEVIANALMRHPNSAEVQFRALFALINLVIPSVSSRGDGAVGAAAAGGAEQQQEVGANNNHNPIDPSTEREAWENIVGQVVELVVLAMKNFCSSEAIMNRACLVLYNLSLNPAYHTTLLWTPNCYQMLEWCLVNYRSDEVLQQSAAGTLHRLQVSLSSDDNLRQRWNSLRAQQQEEHEELENNARRTS